MKKILLAFACAISLVGCQNEQASEEENTSEAEVIEETSRNAQEELQWILENNDLHSPLDSEARILDYNTGKPMGASIYYDLDTSKYEMNIKAGEDYGRFVIGWDAPNAHIFSMENVTPVHSVSESRPNYIEMSDAMYTALYDTSYDGTFVDAWKKSSYVQITAADIDSDNALEFVVYATAPNPETSWYDLHLEVYEYFPHQEQPFERVLQLTESVFAAKPIEITPAGEILVDTYRGDKSVVALCKDGEWYVVDDLFKNNGEHSANYVPYTADYELDYDRAVRSEQNIWRQQCRNEKCDPKNFPALLFNHVAAEEPIIEDELHDPIEEQPSNDFDVEDLNGNSIILQVYEVDYLADFITRYVEKSVEAKNSGDFNIVAGYIEEGSPVYNDMVKSVPATFEKGITMEHHNTIVEKIAADDSYVYFTVVNTFEIFNSTYDGPVSFRSVYKVFVMHDIVQVSELVSDEML